MSEHKNTILAVVLSLLVILGWQYFIGYPQMEHQRQEAQLKQPQQAATQPATPAPNTTQPATPEVPGTPKAGASSQTQAASRGAVIASSPRIASATQRRRRRLAL